MSTIDVRTFDLTTVSVALLLNHMESKVPTLVVTPSTKMEQIMYNAGQQQVLELLRAFLAQSHDPVKGQRKTAAEQMAR